MDHWTDVPDKWYQWCPGAHRDLDSMTLPFGSKGIMSIYHRNKGIVEKKDVESYNCAYRRPGT